MASKGNEGVREREGGGFGAGLAGQQTIYVWDEYLWDGFPSLCMADRLTPKSRGSTLLLKSIRPARTSCGLKCRYEAYKDYVIESTKHMWTTCVAILSAEARDNQSCSFTKCLSVSLP